MNNDLTWVTGEVMKEGVIVPAKKNNEVLFAGLREGVKIPTKREEDAGFDIYANFEEDYMEIKPHETKMIPTGLISAFSSDFVAILKERGSTGTIGICQMCGVVDSGYRGEWFVPITNLSTKTLFITKGIAKTQITEDKILYPYTKGICQCVMAVVPRLATKEVTVDEIIAIGSERGTGCIGSSNK